MFTVTVTLAVFMVHPVYPETFIVLEAPDDEPHPPSVMPTLGDAD